MTAVGVGRMGHLSLTRPEHPDLPTTNILTVVSSPRDAVTDYPGQAYVVRGDPYSIITLREYDDDDRERRDYVQRWRDAVYMEAQLLSRQWRLWRRAGGRRRRGGGAPPSPLPLP